MIKNNNIDHLFYFVTAGCNGNCKICFNRELQQYSSKPDLGLNEVDSFTRSLGKLKTVSLSGGEPFLRKDLGQLCDTIHKNTSFKILTIPTNGLMPQVICPTVLEITGFSRRSLVVVELPLDEISSDFDQIRGTEGAFDLMKETYFGLQKVSKVRSNLHVKFNITFSSYNQHRIKGIINEARAIFGSGIDYSLCMVHGEPRCPEARDVDTALYCSLIKEINSSYHAKNVKSIFVKSLRKISNRELEDTLIRKKTGLTCMAGIRFIVLKHDGTLLPCEPKRNEVLGNIRGNDCSINGMIPSAESIMKDRADCVCDWTCWISRSISARRDYYPKVAAQFFKDLIETKLSHPRNAEDNRSLCSHDSVQSIKETRTDSRP